MSTERKLPNFKKPPVVEVALSLQFDPIERLRGAEIGLFWAEHRGRFPEVEEHFELEPTIERFERPKDGPVIRVSSSDRPPTPRTWFLNEDRTELIQIQRDRFIHNWRKIADKPQPYPRYDYVRGKFEQELGRFRSFLHKEKLGSIKPNQCEVTYVNHIVSGEGWQSHSELASILTVWSSAYSDKFLADPEDASLGFRYVLTDGKGARIGRLNVNLKPAFSRQDGKPIFVLTLTARGAPATDDPTSVMATLDLGHEWIVRGFASMTTKLMHEIWERTDV